MDSDELRETAATLLSYANEMERPCEVVELKIVREE